MEYFGGQLGVLSYPMHGKASIVTRKPMSGKIDVLDGLPLEFSVAR